MRKTTIRAPSHTPTTPDKGIITSDKEKNAKSAPIIGLTLIQRHNKKPTVTALTPDKPIRSLNLLFIVEYPFLFRGDVEMCHTKVLMNKYIFNNKNKRGHHEI